MREPLSSVQGVVLELDADGVVRASNGRLDAALGRRMNRLIADLLDLARLQAGRSLLLDRRRQHVAPLLGEACEMFREEAARNRLRPQCSAPEDLPDIDIDRDRMLQVFSNLIGYAVKFTPDGGRVTVRAEPGEDEVVFSVADTGPGIPETDRRRATPGHGPPSHDIAAGRRPLDGSAPVNWFRRTARCMMYALHSRGRTDRNACHPARPPALAREPTCPVHLGPSRVRSVPVWLCGGRSAAAVRRAR